VRRKETEDEEGRGEKEEGKRENGRENGVPLLVTVPPARNNDQSISF
jgi:hypothetical protein